MVLPKFRKWFKVAQSVESSGVFAEKLEKHTALSPLSVLPNAIMSRTITTILPSEGKPALREANILEKRMEKQKETGSLMTL